MRRRVNSGVGRLRFVIVEMRKPALIYPESFDESRVPKTLRDDITNLFEKVGNWRASNVGNGELSHYKQIARALGFRSEGNFQSFGRKKADLCKLYETEELTYQAIIEIETSTIENGYNDILKMMQLIKSGNMDYGVIIFVQNNRGSRPKLTESQLHSNLVNGLGKVLDDFRGKLFMYHVNP